MKSDAFTCFDICSVPCKHIGLRPAVRLELQTLRIVRNAAIYHVMCVVNFKSNNRGYHSADSNSDTGNFGSRGTKGDVVAVGIIGLTTPNHAAAHETYQSRRRKAPSDTIFRTHCTRLGGVPRVICAVQPFL